MSSNKTVFHHGNTIIQLNFQSVKNQFIAAAAVVEPVGDAGNGGGGNVKFLGDGLVRALVEMEGLSDLKSFGELANFRKSQQIAEETSGFILVFKLQDGGVELLGHITMVSQGQEGRVGEGTGADGGEEERVFQADAKAARQINAGFDGNDHTGS